MQVKVGRKELAIPGAVAGIQSRPIHRVGAHNCVEQLWHIADHKGDRTFIAQVCDERAVLLRRAVQPVGQANAAVIALDL